VVLGHFTKLFLGNWAVLGAIKYLENILFGLEPFIYSLLLLGDSLRLFGGTFAHFLLQGVSCSLFHENLLHLLPVVSDGKAEETLAPSISNFQIDSKSQ
jgi:hypothetical protein